MANTVKWCDVIHRGTQTKVGLYTQPNSEGKFQWVIPLDRSNPVKSDYVFDTSKDALHNAIQSLDWNGFDKLR